MPIKRSDNLSSKYQHTSFQLLIFISCLLPVIC